MQPGMTVVDVGCGPGHAALDLAEIVGPGGRVIGVEESPLFLKHLHDLATARKLANVERILGDAHQLATLIPGEGFVDVAYARWVLCFMRDPEAVVSGVARALKPGGRFAVQDYFNYETMSLAPRRAPFTRVVQAVAASWRARGGDPDVVGSLPAMCRRHGLKVVHLATGPRVARPGSMIWHWPDTFWKSYIPRLVQMGALSVADAEEFAVCWAEASADPDTFLFLPPVFDVLAVKQP